jgi:hypothetical protein
MASMISTLKCLAHRSNVRLASSRETTSRRNGESSLTTSSHHLLDLAQVVVGEAAAGLVEVVIEAVVDRGTDGDLGAGEEALHRVGHDVRGRVADDRTRRTRSAMGFASLARGSARAFRN